MPLSDQYKSQLSFALAAHAQASYYMAPLGEPTEEKKKKKRLAKNTSDALGLPLKYQHLATMSPKHMLGGRYLQQADISLFSKRSLGIS